MKKNLSALTLTLLLSPWSVVNAEPAFTGFSAGINIGAINATTEYTDSFNFDYSPFITHQSNNTVRLGKAAGTVGLTLGYARAWNPCWLWGLEGRANFTNLKSSNSHSEQTFIFNESFNFSNNHNFNIRLDQQYGGIAKIGYLVRPEAQLYAFVGLQWANAKINSGADNDDIPPINYAKFKAGTLIGFGLEQMVSDCISLGMEYEFANYGSYAFNSKGIDSLSGRTVLARDLRVQLKTQALRFRLAYYFG